MDVVGGFIFSHHQNYEKEILIQKKKNYEDLKTRYGPGMCESGISIANPSTSNLNP